MQARAGYCTSRCKFYYVGRLAVKPSSLCRPVQDDGQRLFVASNIGHDREESAAVRGDIGVLSHAPARQYEW